MKQYSSLAGAYDTLNYGCDYGALAEYLAKEIKDNEKTRTELILDLACGTGKLTFMLRDRGFDMTGIDLSEDMLSVAREECYKKNITDILWLCQDMRDFELYGTVDGCVCCLDSINYLTKLKDVKKCFSLVYNYLIPDGVFVFDVNTPHRFENIYGNNDIILEQDGTLCAWQNEYDEKKKLCHFYLSIFTECEDGRYERHDETQSERMYTLDEIKTSLEKCNMEFINAYGDFDFTPGGDECERIYIVAKCRK